MSDFPRYIDRTPGIIASQGMLNMAPGIPLIALGSGLAANPIGDATNQNVVHYIPFQVSFPVTVVKISWINGATVDAAGNIDVGIYDAEGNRLVHATQLQGTASVIQTSDITDTTLSPGLYYMAFVNDSATGQFRSANPSGTAVAGCTGALTQSSSTLPATATFAAGVNRYPVMALHQRTTV